MIELMIGALQDAPPAPPDRIVVTSQRRAEDALTTVESVARIDGETLDLIGAQHVQEALNRAPGVFIHRGSGQEHLTAIRSPVLTGGAGAGSFLFLEDGVPLRAAGFANVNGLFESVSELAGAIEVTRGPGSALYGSNAVHGAVNVLSPEPARDETRFRLSLGSFDRARAAAEVERGAGLYLGVHAGHEGGWRDASGLDEHKLLARLDSAFGGWTAVTTLAATNLNQETAGFVRGPDAYADPALRRTNENPEAFRDARSARLQSALTRDLGGADVTLTPYARWNDMEFLQHFLPSKSLEETGHASLGLLASARWEPAPGTRAAAGLDLEATEGFLTETQDLPSFGPFPQGTHYDYDVGARIGAVHAAVERDVGERLTLEAGVRAEAVRYDYESSVAPGDSGRFRVPASRTDEFTLVTPKLGAVWRTGPASAARLRLARGERAPQTTDLYRLQTGQTGRGANVETLDSVEIGWRGPVGRARLDVAAYAMRKTGWFFRDADGLNVPDGATRHAGIEGEAEVPLGERLRLRASATYARHTYDFDRPVTSNATESIADGDDVDTAPRWLANAALTWTPADALEIEAEWVFVDAYFADAANTRTYPGHSLWNLRAAWRAGEAVSLYGAVRNVFDEAYAERADFAFGSERYFPGEDRAFTFGIASRF